MQRYNLALCPISEEGKALLLSWHAGLAAHTVGYAADGVTGHPHVTLCQFDICGGSHSIGMGAFPADQHIDVQFAGCVRRAGKDVHEGFDWIEVEVVKTPDLEKMQVWVWSELQALGAKIHTGLGKTGYHPHLTLARVPSGAILDNMPQDTAGIEMPMRPALFLCSANGECLQEVQL